MSLSSICLFRCTAVSGLSPEQIEYALDDVRYLLPLKALLEEKLDKLDRLQWLSEELAALDDARSFSTEPETS